jgi:hypothetical protein
MPLTEAQRKRLQELEAKRKGVGATPPQEAYDWKEDWGVVAEVKSPPSTGEGFVADVGANISALEAADVARFLVNTPGSILRNIGLFGHAVWNAGDTIGGLASLANGAMIEAARLLNNETRESNPYSKKDVDTFYQFLGELKKRFGENLRETLVHDPFGVLMELNPISRSLGKIPTQGKFITGIKKGLARSTPLEVATRSPQMLAATARKTGQVGMGVGKEVMGISTGFGPVAFGEVGRIGRIGTRAERKTFRENITPGKADFEGMVNELDDAVQVMERSASRKYEDDLAEIAAMYPGFRFDLDSLKNSYLGWLFEEYGLKLAKDPIKQTPVMSKVLTPEGKPFQAGTTRTGGGYSRTSPRIALGHPKGLLKLEVQGASSPLNQQTINRMAEVVTGVMDLTDDSVLGMKFLHTRLQGKWRRVGKPDAVAGDMLTKSYHRILDELKGSIPEAGTLVDDFKKTQKMIDNAKILLRQGAQDPETTLRKLIQAVSVESATNDIKRKFLTLLDASADKHIAAAAVGAALSTWVPQSLVARQALFGAAATAASGFISPWFILGVPMMSPRIAGEMMLGLGMATGKVQKLEKWLERVRIQASLHVPEMVTPGLNIGTVINKMLEQGVDVPQMPDLSMKLPPADKKKKVGSADKKKKVGSPSGYLRRKPKNQRRSVSGVLRSRSQPRKDQGTALPRQGGGMY